MRLAGLISVVLGLILLGICASQWSAGTGANASRAMTDYNRGDRGDLGSLMRTGDLNGTAQVAVEGVAGVVWLGIGALLLKKASGAQPRQRTARIEVPWRR